MDRNKVLGYVGHFYDQAYNCLIYFYIKYISKITFDGRRPSMEDDL